LRADRGAFDRRQFAIASLAQIIYNLYFHPLRRFPGPVLHRATRIAFVRKLVRGVLPKDVLALHNRYGPVVRVAPNELSFLHPDAWRDIYGHRTGSLLGAEEMGKYDIFYRTKGEYQRGAKSLGPACVRVSQMRSRAC